MFHTTIFNDIFGVTEVSLLATMSYDHCVAIYKPLDYMTIMNKLCKTMVICSWMAALMTILPPLSLDFHLEFCDSNIIDHFFLRCVTSPEDLMLRHMVNWADGYSLFHTYPHHHSLCSSLLHIHHKDNSKIPFSSTKKKAFSACSSYMIVLSISYGICIFIYIKPSAKDGVTINKCVSLLISSISPMLNPFIYTLRNTQVKQGFDDSLKKIAFLLRK